MYNTFYNNIRLHYTHLPVHVSLALECIVYGLLIFVDALYVA